MQSTELVYGLFTPKCYDALVVEHSADAECIKGVVAKLAGYMMISVSFGIKAPQIFKVVANKSVAGLSPVGFYSETLCYIVSAMYNVLVGSPISAYGEVLTILVQNLILVCVIWAYMQPPPKVSTVVTVVVAFVSTAYLCAVSPLEYRGFLPVATVPINIISRVPQIATNFANGHTGQLAAPTVFMSFLGSGLRILTTIQEVGWDRGLLFQYGLAFTLNTIIWSQMLVYWRNTTKVMAAEKAKKAK